jgi:hypothetical protein
VELKVGCATLTQPERAATLNGTVGLALRLALAALDGVIGTVDFTPDLAPLIVGVARAQSFQTSPSRTVI